MTALNRMSCRARSGSASTARAWPGVNTPSLSASCIGRGSWKQAQGVGDGGTALAKPLGQLLLTVRQTLAQGLDGLGLFKRVQILALEVFDKRGGQGVLIGQFPQINRHFGKPGALRGRQRRSPATIS